MRSFAVLTAVTIGYLGLPIPASAAEISHRVADGAVTAIAAAVLEDGRILCVWSPADAATPQTQVMGAYYSGEYDAWFGPRPMLREAGRVTGVALIRDDASNTLRLFTSEDNRVLLRQSDSAGSRWSGPETIFASPHAVAIGTAAANADGMIAGFTENGNPRLAHSTDGTSWHVVNVDTSGAASPPVVTASANGYWAYTTHAGLAHRHVRSFSANGRDWSAWEASNLPSATNTTERAAALLTLDDGRVVSAAAYHVVQPGRVGLLISHDGGRVWPERRLIDGDEAGSMPVLIQDASGAFHVFGKDGRGVFHRRLPSDWVTAPMALRDHPVIEPVAPPLAWDAHRSTPGGQPEPLPLADALFHEHVRHPAGETDWPTDVTRPIPATLPGVSAEITTSVTAQGEKEWVGTRDGLYHRAGNGAFERHPSYGVNGPASNLIAGIAVDSRSTLWIATPAGLSALNSDGDWRVIRGREGLPWEELTSIAVDSMDRIWIGSTRGLILHDPASEERPWYYRAGERYLPGDHVLDVAVSDDARAVFVRTTAGFGKIVEEPLTLHAKAEYLEARYNERHRRLGLASPAQYNDAYTMESWVHGPQPSDGLWSSYHVTAAALAYSLTLEDRYRASAAESMEALYLLQNVTGIEGLVARTLVAVDEPAADTFRDATNYHLTADGRYLWRDDVSSDQLDGHFLAFYTYFEHIAQFDPDAYRRIDAQIRQVLDYILEHDYTIPDWSGERTMWGWWTPRLLNEEAEHFQERGIYSLMMLMFLKTAYYITADECYADLYRELIEDHDFLSNILLEKKLFPDEKNHSDTQLSAVAYYPILQLEYAPYIREALHRAVRRTAYIERAERNSLISLVYASIDPDDADVRGAVRTLREFPRDRRNWRMENSHRTDIVLRANPNRGGRPVLLNVLPYDEHQFERWNQDPYEPDGGGDGRLAGSGEHYLFPYWVGRYHGVISAK